MSKTKKLYTWNWESGGYNQCYADSKAEARKRGNSIMRGELIINESTFRLVKDIKAFWANYPIFD
tara:strand:+ start:879 stop:1073 length:195 start_codon:yes stop_codon:yes gene_type:complete